MVEFNINSENMTIGKWKVLKRISAYKIMKLLIIQLFKKIPLELVKNSQRNLIILLIFILLARSTRRSIGMRVASVIGISVLCSLSVLCYLFSVTFFLILLQYNIRRPHCLPIKISISQGSDEGIHGNILLPQYFLP